MNITYQKIAEAVYRHSDDPYVSPVELVNILVDILIPVEEPIEGPPEEIGTGIYRMADGEIVGNEPEPQQF